MSKATSYNRGSSFNVNFDGLEFIKLSDLYDQTEALKPGKAEEEVFRITGLFINQKSKFGPRPFVSTPAFLADLPAHMLSTIEQMISDPEVVEEINAGKVGFKLQTYTSKTYKNLCYTIYFVDIK